MRLSNRPIERVFMLAGLVLVLKFGSMHILVRCMLIKTLLYVAESLELLLRRKRGKNIKKQIVRFMIC